MIVIGSDQLILMVVNCYYLFMFSYYWVVWVNYIVWCCYSVVFFIEVVLFVECNFVEIMIVGNINFDDVWFGN